ncbi:hypothetical protein B0H19DRAFT_1234631 [Mycena capillaripes]|nr:hypothetical protein B0H19DRAFT_1234631 [Mycena capillaripes]
MTRIVIPRGAKTALVLFCFFGPVLYRALPNFRRKFLKGSKATPHSGASANSARPAPDDPLHAPPQHEASMRLMMGIALALVVLLSGLLIRWVLIRRARRREAFAGPGQTLKPVKEPLPQSYPNEMEHDPELGLYPPSSHATSESAPFLIVSPPDAPPSNPPSSPWPASFSTNAEPGADSSSAARQAYLAAELRAAQTLLERGGKDVDVKATKTKMRELEERQQSAWAQGLE